MQMVFGGDAGQFPECIGNAQALAHLLNWFNAIGFMAIVAGPVILRGQCLAQVMAECSKTGVFVITEQAGLL